MAITPGAGYQQDPQNSNGVIPIGSAPAAPASSTPYVANNAAFGGPNATQAQAGNTATIASLYGSVSPSDKSLNDLTGAYATAAGTPVDEAKIRSDTLARFQAETDATNKVYADKLAQAQIGGEGRLGSNAAISARRGLLGSDFGQAASDTVVKANDQVYGGIQDERNAALLAIQDKGNSAATAEIAAKNGIKQQSATDYINFLAKQEDRRTSRTSDAANALVSSGIDPKTMTPADLQGIADSYGISSSALQSAYTAAHNTAQATKLAQETSAAALAKPLGLPSTDNGFTYDPATGQYKQTSTGTPTDSALKEYQYAVQNNGFTGSLQDWNSQKANAKVSIGGSRDPITGALTTYTKTGPSVAGTGSTKLPSGSGGSVPASSSNQPVSPATPTVPTTGTISNPLDKLSGSDLAYAQTGDPNKAKLKYAGQINEVAARIKAVLPDWSPANAAAQYAFFKSPATQTFIANSNTVLNTLDQIKALSAKIPRGSIQMLNGGQLALQSGVSDTNAAKLVQLATIAGDEAGKLLGGSAGSDFTTALGISLVNPKYSDATFGATIDQLGGRVRNKVSEYYVQGGQKASTDTSQPAASLPPEIDSALSSNAKIDDSAKTITLPRAVWSTFGANMDTVLSNAEAKGYKLLIQ